MMYSLDWQRRYRDQKRERDGRRWNGLQKDVYKVSLECKDKLIPFYEQFGYKKVSRGMNGGEREELISGCRQ